MTHRRLDPLLQRAQEREDRVAQELAKVREAQRLQEQRLEELARFKDEYHQPAPAGGTLNPALLANRQAFIERIEQAVAVQKRAVEQGRGTLEIERTRLLLASRDKQVLEKLAASYRAEEAKKEQKRAQGELDELAGRRRPARLGDGEEPA